MTTENTKQQNQTIKAPNYSEKELAKLRDFIYTLKNDKTRSALTCWGDHKEYTQCW